MSASPALRPSLLPDPLAGSATVTVAGCQLSLLPQGALWWLAERTLVVADLHLEKGSRMAMRGQFVPPYDTGLTLSLIEAANNKARGARNEALTSGALGKADNIAHSSAAPRGLGDTKTAALLLIQLVAPVWVLAACRYTSARASDRGACTWQVVQALRDEARGSVTVSDLVAELQRLQSQLSATHERAHNLVRAQPGRVEPPRA